MTTQNKLKLITHDGSFHTDDIFACAALILYLEKNSKEFSAQGGPASGWEIIRTRDEEIIKNAKKDESYIFDVGGIYNAEQNRFDHHQAGGAGGRAILSRNEGQKSVEIEYASFGLVWKKFGAELCGSKASAELIDKKLVAPIDAHDNGFDLVKNLYETSPYFIQHIFFSMRPTWREENITNDEIFLKSVEIAKEILSREIIQAEDLILAEEIVISIYQNSEDKRIIVLDKNYPWDYTLNNFTEPIFVIYPRKITGDWGIKAVREDPKTFKNRKNFPEFWGGLRDEELQKITGVSDAIFCHRGLFMAVAKSKEGAIKLAQLALLEPSH